MQQGAYLRGAEPEDAEQIWFKRTLEKLVEKKSIRISGCAESPPRERRTWKQKYLEFGECFIWE